MRKAKEGEFRSKVYLDRPDYADLEPPEKFQAILGIIMTRLRQHPHAVCSYSGGSDSDIMLDLIETARKMIPSLPKVEYMFFNTGLEMKAIKRHVNEVAEKYGVQINEVKALYGRAEIYDRVGGKLIRTVKSKGIKNIVQSTREHGIPFVFKIMSGGFEEWQKKGVPLSIADEYAMAEDKHAIRQELRERYPKCESLINFLCCCNREGDPRPNIQLVINSSKYMLDFIKETPPDFKVSAKCCDYCKKHVAHAIQKGYEMVITGERRDEGGMRSVPRSDNTALCFTETASGQYRLRPLYYVSDKDKEWYKETFNIKYSDAYEVYGLTRTGCCGCSISYKAVEDLEKIKAYEPAVVKAAWNIFGKSYEYRQKYNEYKAMRTAEEKRIKKDKQVPGQMSIDDYLSA